MTVPKIIIWHSFYKKKIEEKESKKSKFVLNNKGWMITPKKRISTESNNL